MTKKILALVVSLMLVAALMPAGNALAAVEPSSFYAHDFDKYEVGTKTNYDFTGDNNYFPDKTNGIFSLGTSLRSEIIEEKGYDGTNTNVVKLTANGDYGDKWDPESENQGKMFFRNGTVRPEEPDEKYVIELKVYVPANKDGVNRSFGRFYGAPFMLETDLDNCWIGVGMGFGSGQTKWPFKGEKGAWYSLKYVCDPTGTITTKTNASLYVNDELVAYKEDVNGNGAAFANYWLLQRFSNYDTNAGNRMEEYLLFDDFNFYTISGKTDVSSTFDGAVDVPKQMLPAVTFSEKILEYSGHEDGVISAGKNIEFVNAADDSDVVAIDNLTVSGDGKTLTIDPSELSPSTTYQVTVKNLNDMYGQSIDPYTFTFTTADEPSVKFVEGQEPSFTKENLFALGGSSTPINKLENGFINTTFTVQNTHATKNQNILLLVVLKDGDTITQFQFERGNIAPNGTLTFNGGFAISDCENKSIETYVWDSLYGMTPLAEKYTITASGITPATNE